MEKGKELAVSNAELDQALSNNIPVEPGFTETQFPRINFLSKDLTEESKNKKTGKKEIKILVEAGTFIREVYNKEAKEFEKTELGKSIDVVFGFERRQLKFYDKNANSFVSSPIYDNDEDNIPLFKDKKTVARGTPVELRNKADYIEMKEGKKKFLLEEQKVLYVLFEGEVHQFTIRGSSSWNFSKYKKETAIATVLTTLDSEEAETGGNRYNKMTFSVARDLTIDEKKEVFALQQDIKTGIEEKKAYFAKFIVEGESADDEGNDDEEGEDEGKFAVKPRGSNLKKLGIGKKKPAF